MTGQLPPLPVTVISGYLGAGKTSLVNHLLRHAGGRRIMVMVNDFGALNIDADLLESADEDTLTLSNGCICCTMGTELLYALSDALDRRPRPDCLVIEASGVAQPDKIAAAAHAEPEMRYCGVVAMADAANIADLVADRRIGPQVAQQLRAADLVLVTKTDLAPLDRARKLLAKLTAAPVLAAPRGAGPVDLILDAPARAPHGAPGHEDHGALYRSWSAEGGEGSRAALEAFLNDPPEGLYRFKGRLRLAGGGAVEAHLVGRTWEIARAEAGETRVVAIGVAPEFSREAMARAWAGVVAA
ncbi:MAG: CobW family GTP-binding protein [Pikeienuella sp.]